MSVVSKPATVFLYVVVMLSSGTPLYAASPGHPCAREPDPDRRLSCYDQAFGAPDTRAQSAALEEKERQDFGLAEKQKDERPLARAAANAVDEVGGVIADISRDGRGHRRLTLENGQRWLITESTVRGPLSVGDRITIKQGALSSFMLVTPSGVGLRARRLR